MKYLNQDDVVLADTLSSQSHAPSILNISFTFLFDFLARLTAVPCFLLCQAELSALPVTKFPPIPLGETMKKVLPLILVMAIVLSACTFNAEPTPSLADIQATAEASALTAIAQTQMAMPTEPPTQTPLPPTEAPTEIPAEALAEDLQVVVPQEVAPAVETSPAAPVVVVQQTEAPSSGDGQCDAYLTAGDKGARTSVRIENKSGGPMTLSIYLYPTALNACGSTSVSLARNGETTMDLIEGCYFLYSWVNGLKPSQSSAEYCFRVKDGPRKWVVFPEVIEQR
jgi:hypothetical protein